MWYKSSYGTPRGEGLTPPRTRNGPVRSPRRADRTVSILQPRPDLNWRFRLERAASLAPRRRGRCMAAC